MTKARPSILAVTSELPWPLNSGGHLRAYHLLRALARTYDVRLVAGVTRQELEHVAAVEAAGIRVHPAVLPPRRVHAEAKRMLLAALRREPYVFYRRFDRRAVRRAIRDEIARQPPDILYLDHLDSFMFARRTGARCILLDLHNVYSILTRRTSEESSRNRLSRWYLAHEAALLEQVEAVAIRTADVALSVSAQEQSYFSSFGGAPVYLVPNGTDCSRYEILPVGRRSTQPRILFVGSLSWAPNADAVRFLALDVLPAVQARIPDASLTVVGRDPSPELMRLARPPHVIMAKSVPDVMPYLREARLLAVPLETGGGTRLKILEAFAAGLPVVSTAIGCEGIEAVNGREVIIADGPHFTEAVLTLLQDPTGGEAMAAQARTLARNVYDWPILGSQARQAIEATLASRP